MVYVNGRPVTNHTEAIIVTCIIFVGIFAYGLPYVYNFYALFKKAGERGWAVFIPIYNYVVYARIAKKPIELGVFMALVPAVTVYGESIFVPIAQWTIWAVLGLIIFSGFVKRYKAKRYQWILLLLFPLAASFMVKSFAYAGAKQSTTKKKQVSGAGNWKLP